MPTTTTIVGWAAITAVGVGYWWVTGQRKQKNLRSSKSKQASKGAEPRKDTKVKASKKDGGLSSGDQETKQSQKKKNKKTKQAVAKPVEEESPAVSTSVSKTVDRDEKKDDLEFARQLSNAKKGVDNAPKTQASSRQKSVKQTRAQEKPAVAASESGTVSSNAGADGDDDQSPINSPELRATPATNGDVSDMLEQPTTGPSVLRVTAPTNPTQPKKAKQQTSEMPESKKQKQNRKKAEEAKAVREAEEKERKIKLEAHRRSVREAEGRSAKDGSVFMASQAPASSAWTAEPAVQATNDTVANVSKKLELLDTYEPTNGHVDTKSAEQVKAESKGTTSKLADELAFIPEDEQMRRAKEESNNWEEVKPKHQRKQKAVKEPVKESVKEPVKETVKEASKEVWISGGPSIGGIKVLSRKEINVKDDDPTAGAAPGEFGPPEVIAPTGPGKTWIQNVVYKENGKWYEETQEIVDSEWEVS